VETNILVGADQPTGALFDRHSAFTAASLTLAEITYLLTH